MNNLEALIIVRGAARVSAQMRTRRGIAAGKVVDRKIQSLMRKKAWRDGGGAPPVHMGDDDFRYQIPDDPVTAALRRVLASVEALGRIKDGKTLFESSPTGDAECHAAWLELHDARQAAAVALGDLENAEGETRRPSDPSAP